jgi:hypothetical protein
MRTNMYCQFLCLPTCQILSLMQRNRTHIHVVVTQQNNLFESETEPTPTHPEQSLPFRLLNHLKHSGDHMYHLL